MLLLIVLSNSKVLLMVYDNLYKFIFDLDTNNFAVWEDDYGSFKVLIGNGIAQDYINRTDTKIITSDFINIEKKQILKFNSIVSIGSFSAHNFAKTEAQNSNVDLITIPVPLSNDSFGTNRCSKGNNEQEVSFECVFPHCTVFDLDILVDFGINESISGTGEYLGLYFSIIDYHIKNNTLPDEKFMKYVVANFFEFLDLFENNAEAEIIKKICILLILKCIVMRHNINHEIGCGIDHSFARVFEKESKILHGKAVFLGSILSSLLFPDWGKWGLNTKTLIKSGKKINIISDFDIVTLSKVDLKSLINKAIDIRPYRNTMLNFLSAHDIQKQQEELRKLSYGIYQN